MSMKGYGTITITDVLDGAQIWTSTTAPTSPNYTFTIANLIGDPDAEIKIGDLIFYSYYRYTVQSISNTTVLTGSRTSIRGETGAQGTSVVSIYNQYYLSTSSTTQLDGDWVENIPDYIDGRYYWSRPVTKLSNNNVVYGTPVLETSITELMAKVTPGVGMKINYSAFNTPSSGKMYIHGYSNESPADIDGCIYWNNVKRTVPKKMINPNAILPYNKYIYIVLRLSSAAATTGTLYMVWYNSGWKYAITPTPSAVGGTWNWTETTDIVLGQFIQPGAEQDVVQAYLYNPPRTASQVKTTNASPYQYSQSAVDWYNSNGRNVVNATTMLAAWADGAFSATTEINGGFIKAHTIQSEHLATNAIMSSNFQGSDNPSSPFSATGTFLDLATGNIYSPNFGIDNTYGKAYLNGEIIATSGRIGNSSATNYWEIGTKVDYNAQQSAALIGKGTAYIQVGDFQLSNGLLNARSYNQSNQITYPKYDNTYWDFGVQAPILDTSTTGFVSGVDDNFIYIRKHVNTIPTLKTDWDYVFRIDKTGMIYMNDVSLDDRYALKTDVGSTYLPVSGGTITGNLTVNGTLNAIASQASKLTKTITINGTSWDGSSSTTIGTMGVQYGGTGATTFTSGYALIGNGQNAIQTRAITNNTSATYITGNTNLITANTLKFWNGAYDTSHNSNLEYVKLGKIGDVVTHDIDEFITTSGGIIDGSLQVTDLTAGNLIVTGAGRFTNGLYGDLTGTADSSLNVKDSGNGTATTFGYSKAGLSTTSWFAAWNGYELRAISPANTKSAIGLGNVDNTADANKNVLTATKFSSSRTIALTGDVTGSASSDGTSGWSIAATVGDNSHNHNSTTIVPLQSKTYTGVIASANDQANAALYFIKVQPSAYGSLWSIRYKITATIDNISVANGSGYETSIVYLAGMRDTYSAYSTWNDLTDGSYRPYSYHCFYRAKEAGITGGYGHALGVNLIYSYNLTTTTNKRNITVEILETSGCTVTLLNTPLKYADWPGNGTTNYNTYSNFDGTTYGMTMSGDRNDVNYYNRNYYGCRIAYEAIYRYQFCLSRQDRSLIPVSDGNNVVAKTKTMTTAAFDPFGEYLYWASTTTYSAGTNVGDGWYNQYLADLRYAFNIGGYNTESTLIGRKPLYLVATPQSDGTAKLYSDPLAQDLPTTEDGLIYIYLGQVYPDTYPYRLYMSLHHPVYIYKNGGVQYYVRDAMKADSAGKLTTGRSFTVGKTSKTVDWSGAVSFTQSEISDNASGSAAGWMSAAHYTKLEGIAAGAQVNSITGVKGNSETSYRTGNVNITATNIGLGNLTNDKQVKGLSSGTTANNLVAWGSNGYTVADSGIAKGSVATKLTLAGTDYSASSNAITVTQANLQSAVQSTGLVLMTSAERSKLASIQVSEGGTIDFSGVTASAPLTATIAANKTVNITHNTSGISAGTYRSVTVNTYGHVTAGTNPTTLSGYGITDAKIASGVITLGSNTITPLTASSTLDATKLSGTASISTTGNAGTATKFNSTRKIQLTGDVNGSATTDGSSGWSIATTVADNSHNHAPNNIVQGNSASAGTLDPLTQAMIGSAASNKSFGLPAEAVQIEYSTDGGITWADYGATDAQKEDLFSETRASGFYIGKGSSASLNKLTNQLRITITPTDRYVSFNGLYLWFSSQGNTCTIDLERSTIGAKDTFVSVFTEQSISGWSGNNIRYFNYGSFGGGSTQTGNNYKYRIIFKQTAINSNYASGFVNDIRFLGLSVWSSPNNMVSKNHMYTWDRDLNVTFPAQITATKFNGTATTANNLSGFTNTTTSATAIDSAIQNGILYVSGTSGIYNVSDGSCFVQAYSSSWVSQIYQDYRSGQIALRSKNNGTWQPWRKVLDSENYTTYTVTKTGTGASGTWGIDISGNAATATTASKWTSAQTVYVTLGTASTTTTLQGGSSSAQTIGVNGTLAVGNGGTGKTTGKDAANYFMNSLDTGSSTPVDADYYISQYVGGGTTTTTYHRRPMSALWSYVQGKISSVLGLSTSGYTGNAATATSATKATQDSSGNTITSTYAKLSGATFTGAVTGTSFGASSYVSVNTGNSQTAGGLALYGTTPTTYGIAMRGTGNGGKHGYVQGDWAIYSYMSGADNRGWILRNSSANVASVSNLGNAVFNGSVTVGGNATNDSGCRLVMNESTSSLDFIFN